MATRSRTTQSGPAEFPVLLFNVESGEVATRLEHALASQGLRVAVETRAGTASGEVRGRRYDALLVTSHQPVHTAVADARRRFPRATAVSTVVVDGVVIAQPFEAAPQGALKELARIRGLARTVRAAIQAA